MTEVHSTRVRPDRGDKGAGGAGHPVHVRVMRGLDHYSRFGNPRSAARIEQVGDGEYLVPSGSVVGFKYRVRLDVEGRDLCVCADYGFEGRKHGLCKHTVAAMLFHIRGGSLGFARRHAAYWIEYRTGIRNPEAAYCPRNGYVICYAMVYEDGRRYITEILPNTNVRHYRADRFRLLDSSATLVGTYEDEQEMQAALGRFRRERGAA